MTLAVGKKLIINAHSFFLLGVEVTIYKLCWDTFLSSWLEPVLCRGRLSSAFHQKSRNTNFEKVGIISLTSRESKVFSRKKNHLNKLAHKAPTIICSRRQIKILPIFQK